MERGPPRQTSLLQDQDGSLPTSFRLFFYITYMASNVRHTVPMSIITSPCPRQTDASSLSPHLVLISDDIIDGLILETNCYAFK